MENAAAARRRSSHLPRPGRHDPGHTRLRQAGRRLRLHQGQGLNALLADVQWTDLGSAEAGLAGVRSAGLDADLRDVDAGRAEMQAVRAEHTAALAAKDAEAAQLRQELESAQQALEETTAAAEADRAEVAALREQLAALTEQLGQARTALEDEQAQRRQMTDERTRPSGKPRGSGGTVTGSASR